VVRLPSALRPHAGGLPTVALEVPDPVTIAAVADALDVRYPAVGRRLRDEAGVWRRHVNVFVGVDNIRSLDGPDTVVPEGAEVSVLPAVSGG